MNTVRKCQFVLLMREVYTAQLPAGFVTTREFETDVISAPIYEIQMKLTTRTARLCMRSRRP